MPSRFGDQVGQPVQIREEVVALEQSLGLQADHPALCAPDDRACQLKGRAGPGLARDHELARHVDPFLELDNERGQ